jgi:hypothetical protein
MRRSRRGIWPTLRAQTCLLAYAAVAGAQGRQPTTFEWEAPPECPQFHHVTVEVEQHLGQALGVDREQRLAIAGKVTSDASRGFVASIAVTTEHGTRTRELVHLDCRKLSEAAALVVALTIDPTLSAKFPEAATPITPATEPEGAPPEVTPPPPLPVAPPIVEPAPVVRKDAPPSPTPARADTLTDWRFDGALVGALAEGPLPELGVGLGAHVSVERSFFAAGARVSYYFPRPAPIEADSSAFVELDLLSVTLFGCFLPVGGRLSLGLCPGLVLGDLRGFGKGVDNPRTQHARYSAVTLETVGTYETRAGAVVALGLGVGKTLEAPPFGIHLNGREHEVFVPDAWMFQGFLGFGIAGP